MITPPIPPPLAKRLWTVFRHEPYPVGLAAFFAVDQTLARRYADLLWPAIAGVPSVDIEPADAVRHPIREQARLRFLFDCDVAAHQADFVAAPAGRVCLMCGCTDDNACPGGCWWAAPGLCSSCCSRAGVDPFIRAAIELAVRDTDSDALPPELSFDACPQAAQLLRQACFAMHAGQARTCLDRLVAAAQAIAPHAPPAQGATRLLPVHADVTTPAGRN